MRVIRDAHLRLEFYKSESKLVKEVERNYLDITPVYRNIHSLLFYIYISVYY